MESRKSFCFTSVIALGVGWGLLMLLLSASTQAQVDLELFLEAAKKLFDKQSIYLPYQIPNQPVTGNLYFLYPPLFPLLLKPLLLVSKTKAYLIWGTFSFAALSLACYQLAQIIKPTLLKNLFVQIFIAAMIFGPIWSGWRDGQVHCLILALITTYIFFLDKEKNILAGSILALAAWIKMSPALLILWPLINRNYKAVSAFIISSTAIFCLLAICPITANSLPEFLSQLPKLAEGELFNHRPGNYSLSAVASRFANIEIKNFINISLIIISFAVLVPLRKVRNKNSNLYSLSFLVCIMLLASPILWIHHLTWTLIPLSALLIEARHSGKLKTGLVLSFLLIATFEKLPQQLGIVLDLNLYLAWALIPSLFIIYLAIICGLKLRDVSKQVY